MRRRPKSKSLSWYCRSLINEYVSNEIDDDGFKEKLRFILDEFAGQNRLRINTATSLCSWIMGRRHAEDYRLKVEKFCDLTSEVDIPLGKKLQECDFYVRQGNMNKDIEKIKKITNLTHDEVGHTEENVKLKIVVPLLELLGHKKEDLDFEYRTGKSRKIDIFIKNVPGDCKVIIDTKNYDENLASHVAQIKEYTFEESALLAILVNGSEIRIYSPLRGVSFEKSLLYIIERQKLTDKSVWGILSDFLGKENLQNKNVIKSIEKREQEIKEAISSEEGLNQEYETKIKRISEDIDSKKEEIRQLDKESEASLNELKTKIAEIWRPLGLPFDPPRISQVLVYKEVVPDTSGDVKIKKGGRGVKVYLQQLVDVGLLKDGQSLYFYHGHHRYDEQVQIIAPLNKLKYGDGKLYSASGLAKILLKKHGLTRSKHGVRGPKFWVTKDGTLLHDLNDRFRRQHGIGDKMNLQKRVP